MMFRALALVCASLLWVACDSGGSSEGSSADTSTAPPGGEGGFVSAPDEGCSSMQVDAADIAHVGPGAGISGLVLDNECNPLPNYKVLCCTSDSCVPTDTREDGTFYLGGIMNQAPRKVRIIGVTHGYYDALVYLPVTGEELTIASKPIVLAPLAAYATLPAEAGGTATLAGGQLEITVAAGAMKYPLGHFEEELSAERVDLALIGPFDTTPWADADGAMAFVFDPYDMSVQASESGDEVLSLAFHGEDPGPAGTVYDLWSADTHDAHMVAAGTATVGDDGVIRVDAAHAVSSLHTLVIAPQ